MMKDATAPKEPLKLGKGPFIFSGIPPICDGDIELDNCSDEKVKIRTIPTVDRDKKDIAELGLGEVRLGVKLKPHSSAKVNAYFAINKCTPPGTYKTEISIGGRQEQVTVHVLENPGFQVTPSRVVIRGHGGDNFSQLLLINNYGNITHTLPGMAEVWFEEQDWVRRTLVYALRESTGKEGYQSLLDKAVSDFHESMIPSVNVELEYDMPEIGAGQTCEVIIKGTLPEKLKKGRTYYGFIKLMGKRLWMEVQCNGSSISKKGKGR